MMLFVIHRFKDRKLVKQFLKKVGNEMSASFNPILLNSSKCKDWKEQALKAFSSVEAVIVYNRTSCNDSENALWEIEKAVELNLPIIDVTSNDTQNEVYTKLKSLYELEADFNKCFKNEDNSSVLELYKLMITTSENLIQRRQKTNAFFITTIGSLLAIAGLILKTGALNSNTIWILYGFSVVSLLLCNSWSNLIDNYGKLNKAKFGVLLQLEKKLSAQIFEAEWVSLGKGLRPKKYRSFTSTERNVPLYFAILILVLTLMAIAWQIWLKK